MPPAPSWSVPAAIEVAPLSVLSAASTSVPAPALVRPPVPATMEAIVAVRPSSTVTELTSNEGLASVSDPPVTR